MYYLRGDFSVVCYESEAYTDIIETAYVLILLWPVGMVVLYALLLVPVATPIKERRSSQLAKATEFLHGDYEPGVFWYARVPSSPARADAPLQFPGGLPVSAGGNPLSWSAAPRSQGGCCCCLRSSDFCGSSPDY